MITHLRIHFPPFNVPLLLVYVATWTSAGWSGATVRSALALHEQAAQFYGARPTPKQLAALGVDYAESARTHWARAAELRTEFGEHDVAARNLEEVAALSTSEGMRLAARWRALQAYATHGDTKTTTRLLRDLTRVDSSTPEHLRGLLTAYADHTVFMSTAVGPRGPLPDPDQHVHALYVALEGQPGSPEAALASRAMLTLARQHHVAWEALVLTGPIERQSAALQAKIEGSRTLMSAYERVYTYQYLPSTLAAGYEHGRIFDGFADTLWRAQIPFPEGTEEHTLYAKQLHDIALPLQDEAIQRYEAVVNKAAQLDVITPEVRAADARLVEIVPGYASKLGAP